MFENGHLVKAGLMVKFSSDDAYTHSEVMSRGIVDENS